MSDDVRRKAREKDLKEFVDDNADVDGILLYGYYKDSEKAGVMLEYETCYCCPSNNINKFMREYNDILLKEYGKLNEREIDFVSVKEERVYVSFRTSIYSKDYLAIFIISARSGIEGGKLELKVEKLKRNFLLRITN